MSLLAPSSKIPVGQPEARRAWVQRAAKRQRNDEALRQGLCRIDPERRALYEALMELISRAQAQGLRVVLDSGCGTGESTRARVGPGRWILGLDKSLARMQRGASQGLEVPIWREGRAPNAGAMDLAIRAGGVLVRGELAELVGMLFLGGRVVQQLDFLYPNPWPKSQHFGRRWYGHPIWPYALAVSQELQLRTNWEIYAQEFVYALGLWVPQGADQGRCESLEVQPGQGLTAFEEKYVRAGHPLYRVYGRGGAQGERPGQLSLSLT